MKGTLKLLPCVQTYFRTKICRKALVTANVGAKLFNMLPIKMKQMEDPNTFKTMTKDWIWENISSY